MDNELSDLIIYLTSIDSSKDKTELCNEVQSLYNKGKVTLDIAKELIYGIFRGESNITNFSDKYEENDEMKVNEIDSNDNTKKMSFETPQPDDIDGIGGQTKELYDYEKGTWTYTIKINESEKESEAIDKPEKIVKKQNNSRKEDNIKENTKKDFDETNNQINDTNKHNEGEEPIIDINKTLDSSAIKLSKEKKYKYKVVEAPGIIVGSVSSVLKDYENLINSNATDGWMYYGTQSVLQENPPKQGCGCSKFFPSMGGGAVPQRRTVIFLIFVKEE